MSTIMVSLARLQAHLFEGSRPRVRVDQHQRRLGHPRPDAAWPDVLEDGPEPYALVEDLLDLMEHRLALLPAGLHGLLPVERVVVGIAAVGVGALARHELRHPGRRVAVEPAAAHAHSAE